MAGAAPRESTVEPTAASAAAVACAAAVVRTYYGASEAPLAQPPARRGRRGRRARWSAGSVLTTARWPWRRAAKVEMATEIVEIGAEITAEVAAEITTEITAEVAAEVSSEIEVEALTLTRPRPQDRYTSEVGAEIEVACSTAVACEAYADLESFPQYAPLLKCVRVLGEGRSEWELQLPGEA